MTARMIYTGERCACRPGVQRDNCPQCEGTGRRLDFAAIRARTAPTYYTCPECEANFRLTGAQPCFPPHSFRGLPCAGTGRAANG